MKRLALVAAMALLLAACQKEEIIPTATAGTCDSHVAGWHGLGGTTQKH